MRWRLIGKNPQGVARFVRDDPRIELRGPVEDAVSAIAPAKAGVVPVVSGSGTRLKILEMWAAGIPVVSTALGAEGLGAEPGSHLLVADQRNDFADCVSELLSSEQRRRELGAAGRSLYEERFTWEAGWRALDRLGVLLP